MTWSGWPIGYGRSSGSSLAGCPAWMIACGKTWKSCTRRFWITLVCSIMPWKMMTRPSWVSSMPGTRLFWVCRAISMSSNRRTGVSPPAVRRLFLPGAGGISGQHRRTYCRHGRTLARQPVRARLGYSLPNRKLPDGQWCIWSLCQELCELPKMNFSYARSVTALIICLIRRPV